LSKTVDYKGRPIVLRAPSTLQFETDFHECLYNLIYNAITGPDYGPFVDVDDLANGSFGLDIVAIADAAKVKLKAGPSAKASNRDRLLVQLYVRHFLASYPEMVGLVFNTVLLAENSIENAEILLGAPCDATNFIAIKQVIDDLNTKSWSRDKDVSEGQSGVATLGTISESLLNRVFDSMVDDTNFFKVNASQVQSYGDFVLMCLPNNLWISVKSNFARERLLASGYSNDILGVGFFESFDEFTGQIRVRNFQRAGFLAMYCPDVAVSEAQVAGGTSTYQQIFDFHAANGTDMPKNINGRPFIRRLSDLQGDLQPLLDEKDVRKRFTVSF
jgi:hypothetical protein